MIHRKLKLCRISRIIVRLSIKLVANISDRDTSYQDESLYELSITAQGNQKLRFCFKVCTISCKEVWKVFKTRITWVNWSRFQMCKNGSPPICDNKGQRKTLPQRLLLLVPKDQATICDSLCRWKRSYYAGDLKHHFTLPSLCQTVRKVMFLQHCSRWRWCRLVFDLLITASLQCKRFCMHTATHAIIDWNSVELAH